MVLATDRIDPLLDYDRAEERPTSVPVQFDPMLCGRQSASMKLAPLRVAVPNKGILSASTSRMMSDAGYHQRTEGHELMVLDEENNLEVVYLRPRDIPLYVASGRVDLGVTGRDILVDSEARALVILNLNFGHSTFRFAARAGAAARITSIEGLRIATAYPRIVHRYLVQNGVVAEVVQLDGAVEISIHLGIADIVADVVYSGKTLRAAGLEVFGSPILESQAVLIGRNENYGRRPQVDVIINRLEGVMVAQRYVLLEYNVALPALDAAIAVAPGRESPTIAPLYNREGFAVRVMVARTSANALMDELHTVGARNIVLTSIQGFRC